MREVELWQRMDEVLPGGYAASWADQVVLEELGSKTVREALAAGQPCNNLDTECAAGLTCTNKVCQVRATPMSCQ